MGNCERIVTHNIPMFVKHANTHMVHIGALSSYELDFVDRKKIDNLTDI